MVNKRFLFVTVIIILLIFMSWNFSVFFIHYHHNEASSLNDDISELRKMIEDNPEAVKKLDEIDAEVRFLNSFVFNKEIEDIED